MQLCVKLCFLFVLVVLVCQTTSLPSRLRRQSGFSWEDIDINGSRPQRPQRPQRRPFPDDGTGNGDDGFPVNQNSGSTTTTPSPRYTACVSACQVTNEYNPVCATNGQTFDNENKLKCAIRCGLAVRKNFGGTCQPL